MPPEFELLDLSGPLCAFTLARGLHAAPYEVDVISTGGGQVTAGSGIAIATGKPADAKHGDTIVVVGGPTAHQTDRQPELVALLSPWAVRRRTRLIVSQSWSLC